MRLLVLTSSYPTPTNRVASAFLEDWVGALSRRGHALTVASPCDQFSARHVDRSGSASVSYFQYLPWPGLQTLAYGAGMYDNVRGNLLRLLQLAPFLHAQYRHACRLARDADLVHAHWLFPAGLVGAMVEREVGVPLVVTIHSTDLHLLRSIPGGRALAHAIIGRAHRLHFVSHYHRQAFDEFLGSSPPVPSYVVPMGISDAMAEQPKATFRPEPRIGFMGRLIPLKGVDRLFRACAALGRPEVHVAGAGPAGTDLVRSARDLRLRARFVGPLQGQAKIDFLDSCDVLVFPSRHYVSGRSEGLPVSVLEALARGRVVVASDSGGIPEVVRHSENGYVFAAEDEDALRDVLGSVVRSWPTARLVSARARQSGRGFAASALAERHEEAYRDVAWAMERARESA